jgi:hypothetical protein|tara:strand:- start:1203 stop:1535 length:333 start_codon:yes stop_codon:yes gene_type:complete
MTNINDENTSENRVTPTFNGVATPTEHISSILGWLKQVMTGKYHRGQQEHGGSLWQKPGALANLEEEIMDLPVYYKTAKDQLRQMALEGKSAADAYEWLYGVAPTDTDPQ